MSRVGLGVSLSIELEIVLSYLSILILASLKRMDKTLQGFICFIKYKTLQGFICFIKYREYDNLEWM